MSESMMVKLCQSFKQRSEALGYKGKQRDKAFMDYLVGAAIALDLAGDLENSKHVVLTTMCFAMRGYSEIDRIINQ